MLGTEFIENCFHAQRSLIEIFKEKLDEGMDIHIQNASEVSKSLLNFLQYLIRNPQQLQDFQSKFLQNQLEILNNISHEDVPLIFKDKRFRSSFWYENPFYSYLAQSYLNLSQQIQNTLNDLQNNDPELGLKVKFYLNQLLDALSPSNFIMTNPEILDAILKTQGANLKEGFEKLARDLQESPNFKMNPEGAFKVGENIAITPGDIVFKNELMELIHYKPKGKKAYSVPLLIIPPWINKYYIFDLSPENSFVKWLVSQKIDIYIISWINPAVDHKDISFEDYMTKGIMEAEKEILKLTSSKELNFLGYCLGGILLSCYMAYMGEKNISTAKSATFFATPLDFTKSGDLQIFVNENQINYLENFIAKNGIVDGNMLFQVFSILRSKEMIWDTLVNTYMLGKDPRPLDFLFWNSDVTNLPGEMYKFYVRKFYLENSFFKKDNLKLKNTPIDLSKIMTETFWLSTREDHIAPFISTLSGLNLLKSPFEFVLGESGHVAGIFNPANSLKYGFTSGDEYKTGSWWPHWLNWLTQRSGTLQKVTNVPGLYPAPGMYVK